MSQHTIAPPSTTMKSFPFCKLPPELRNAIQFESGLDQIGSLALTVALNKPEKELAIVHKFLSGQIRSPILAIQHTVYRTEALQGSYDWPRYEACKQALYNNPGLTHHESDHAIPFSAIQDVISKAEFVEAIFVWYDTSSETFVIAMSISAGEGERPANDRLDNFKHPSNTELQRMVLSVYQLDAYRRLLGKGANEMSYEEAASVGMNFFRNLAPWEKEQLLSLCSMIAEVLYDDINKEIIDTEWGSYRTWVGHFHTVYGEIRVDPVYKRTRQHLAKTGFPTVNHFGQEMPHKEVVMLRMGACVLDSQDFLYALNSSRPLDERQDHYEQVIMFAKHMPWSVLMDEFVYPGNRETGADSASTDDTDSEPGLVQWTPNSQPKYERDNGPNASWWILFESGSRDAQWGPSNDNAMYLRACGVIFWDEDRADRHFLDARRFAHNFALVCEGGFEEEDDDEEPEEDDDEESEEDSERGWEGESEGESEGGASEGDSEGESEEESQREETADIS